MKNYLTELDALIDEQLNEFKEKDDYVARGIWGTRNVAAFNAPRGKKLKAYGKMLGHEAKETGKGAAVGAGAGLAGVAALARIKKKSGINLGGKGLAKAAGIGALGGALIGNIKGNFGKEADRKYREATKYD